MGWRILRVCVIVYVNAASPVVSHWWSSFIVCLGIGRVEYLIGKVVHCYVEVTGLYYGHHVTNGVLSCDVAVQRRQLLTQYLIEAGAKPVHAYRYYNSTASQSNYLYIPHHKYNN